MFGKKETKNPNIFVDKKAVAKKNRPLFVVGAVVGIYIIGIASGYALARSINPNNSGSTSTAQGCDGKSESKIYDEAAAVLASEKKDQLQVIINKIQADPKYEKDPNCLYPVLVYSLNTMNVADAKTNKDKFVKVYDSKKGLAVVYKGHFTSVEDIDKRIQYLEKYNEQMKNNATFTR